MDDLPAPATPRLQPRISLITLFVTNNLVSLMGPTGIQLLPLEVDERNTESLSLGATYNHDFRRSWAI